MKRVVVACGNGVATSQSIAFRINRMLEKEHIQNVKVEAVNLRSLERELQGAIAYVDIMHSKSDYGVPTIDGLAFLSGENKEKEFQKLLHIIEHSKGDVMR
ncbi:PTS sugar transporter subunit IIB [Amedibacillus sp. YH-ame10]